MDDTKLCYMSVFDDGKTRKCYQINPENIFSSFYGYSCYVRKTHLILKQCVHLINAEIQLLLQAIASARSSNLGKHPLAVFQSVMPRIIYIHKTLNNMHLS